MDNKYKNYNYLDVYKKAYILAVQVHKMSLNLPGYELYEQGSQLRRSSKSIVANIVEGYGRRRYKGEFVKFLTYAQSSCDETIVHIKLISDTHDLKNKLMDFVKEYDHLGKMINKYIQFVDSKWDVNMVHEP
jgi:four helix bundle protein